MTTKNIILAIVLIIVLGSIVYLESTKVKPAFVQNSGDIPIDIAVQNAAKEVSSTEVQSPSKPIASVDRIKTKQAEFPRAKEISSPDGFINTTTGFTLAGLVGRKVILVDFWTYSCINCIRTTPYLNAWYEKYKNQGLEIVGVHTPEFDFEKNYDNVAAAVKRENIMYPVVLDNDYSTWTAYQNRFWPRRYLIDIDGFIVFDQIGEGNYDAMEEQIQSTLRERAKILNLKEQIAGGMVTPHVEDTPPLESWLLSPETYFGAARNGNFANGVPGTPGNQTLTIPDALQANALYLGGTWHFEPEYAQNTSASAKIVYRYEAKNVYFVASSDSGVKIKILRDGKPLAADIAGDDVSVANGEATVTIKENRLYKIIKESASSEHTLEIQIENPGLRAFTFTFG